MVRGHRKGEINAINVGNTRAQGNEGIHIGREVQHRTEAADEEPAIDNENSSRDHSLHYCDNKRICDRQRGAPHHSSHGYIHQRNEKADRDDKTPDKLLFLSILHTFIYFFALFSSSIATFHNGGDDFLVGYIALNDH